MTKRPQAATVPQPDVDAPYAGASESYVSGWCISMDDDRCTPIFWSPSAAAWMRCKCECHDGLTAEDVRAGTFDAFDRHEYWRSRRFP